MDKKKITIAAYDQNAVEYSSIFSKYKSKNQEIARALENNLSKNERVLELGCASGLDAREIISKVGAENYLGIDASGELIKLARITNPTGKFQVEDITNEKFWLKAGKFGVILFFYTLLHVERESAVRIIENCHSSLENKGILSILGKFGAYKEIEIMNFGSKKYYYSYTPEEIEGWVVGKFKTIYKVIKDTDYGPSFELVLQKI